MQRCGVLSLTRGRVCHLELLLALASAVILGSESGGTRDHILVFQIRDFPFRRLLRLSGLRWRYSTPPPHEIESVLMYTAANPRRCYIRGHACWFPRVYNFHSSIHGHVCFTPSDGLCSRIVSPRKRVCQFVS
jgi:hypothetical protein